MIPTLDTESIEDRLRRRVTLLETAALAFPLALALGLVGFGLTAGLPFAPDFDTYLNASINAFDEFYYAYWSVPLFDLLRAIPVPYLAYLIWTALNIAGIFFAARVFGGSAVIALLSYQMLFNTFYGQITGVIIAGLALVWWGLHRDRPLVVGVGMLLAAIKWQMGLPLILMLWLLAETSWRVRWQALILPAVISLLSLVAYPLWPLAVIQRLGAQPPSYHGSIALWHSFGALSLLLWLPPLGLPLPRTQRLVALTAAAALAVPYFQHTGLLALYALPIGWLGLIGNLGYVYVFTGESGLWVVALMPLIAYAWALIPALRLRFSSFQTQQSRVQ